MVCSYLQDARTEAISHATQGKQYWLSGLKMGMVIPVEECHKMDIKYLISVACLHNSRSLQFVKDKYSPTIIGDHIPDYTSCDSNCFPR